jgi:hypothetical protein
VRVPIRSTRASWFLYCDAEPCAGLLFWVSTQLDRIVAEWTPVERRAQTGKADRATVEGRPVRVKPCGVLVMPGRLIKEQRRPWQGRVVSIHGAGGAAQHFAG